MAYNPAIPQATDRLRNSQGDLLGNFSDSSGGLGTMLNPNQGYIQFPIQGATPTLTPPQPGMYAQVGITGVQELFINKNIFGAAQNQIPFTASSLSTTAPAAGQQSWFYLPSGYLVKCGTQNVIVPSPITTPTLITYPVNALIPAFATVISAQFSVYSANTTAYISITAGLSITGASCFINNVGIGSTVTVSYYTVGIGA